MEIINQPRMHEAILGVKNFRRDLAGLVAPLAAMPPIDPRVEPLDDPDTFNKRFKMLAMGLRQAFNAAGDVAIRDKRYLDTFLKGYVNTINTTTVQADNWNRYVDITNFNRNGTPLTFPEKRVAIDIDAYSNFDFAAVYFWVFVDGIMLEPSYVRNSERVDAPEYNIVNTAFGVKCFIKASAVPAGATVSVVTNRIFNHNREYVTLRVPRTTVNSTYLVPIADLDTFYHHKYIKVYVKRYQSNTTHVTYYELPRDRYFTSTNTTGTTVKIDVIGFQLNQGETLLVMNTVNFWEFHAKGSTGATLNHEVELNEIQEDGSYLPIPFMGIEDFDVFFNGWHLTPGEHYTIIVGNEITSYKLKLLFTPSAKDPWRLDVYHNEAVATDKDTIIVRQTNYNPKGLIPAGNFTSLPMTPALGHIWVNDKFYPNKEVSQKHRRIVYLGDKNDTTKRLSYVMRVVCTLDIEEVLSFVNDHISEFDLVGEWVGLDNIMSTVYSAYPTIVNNVHNLTFNETYMATWEFFDANSAAVEQLRYIIKWYEDNDVAKPLILDSNRLLTEADYPLQLVGKMLTLDSNVRQSSALVINANTLFLG